MDQGDFDIELFGKSALKWSDNDIELAVNFFHDCAIQVHARDPVMAAEGAQSDTKLFGERLRDIVLRARNLNAQIAAQKLAQQEERDQEAADEDRGYQYPNWYAYMQATVAGGQEVFKCDYTTRTCLRGVEGGGIFVGVVLAEDRKTVLAHISCQNGNCTDYDRGIEWYNTPGAHAIQGEDFPESCVAAMRERHERCDPTPIAIDSRWSIGGSYVMTLCKNKGRDIFSKSDCTELLGPADVVVETVEGSQVCVRSPDGGDCYWVDKQTLDPHVAGRSLEDDLRDYPGIPNGASRPLGLPRPAGASR